jgi:hypothetical protein
MKTQEHNKGELAELRVEIEKDVIEAFKVMSEKTEMPLADLVVIALKRFKSSHNDYMGRNPKLE